MKVQWHRGGCASVIVAASLLTTLSAHAEAPSSAAVEELLQYTPVQNMLEGILVQIETNLRRAIQQSLKGEKLNAAQQNIADDMTRRFVASMREDLGWQAVKPDVVRAYVETFDRAEVEGLLDFFRSATGRAFIERTPQASRRISEAMQFRTATLASRIEAAAEAAVREIQRAR